MIEWLNSPNLSVFENVIGMLEKHRKPKYGPPHCKPTSMMRCGIFCFSTMDSKRSSSVDQQHCWLLVQKWGSHLSKVDSFIPVCYRWVFYIQVATFRISFIKFTTSCIATLLGTITYPRISPALLSRWIFRFPFGGIFLVVAGRVNRASRLGGLLKL